MAVFMPTTLTGHVYERAAGVAGVDGGVSLDEFLELLGEPGGVAVVGDGRDSWRRRCPR